MKKSTFLIICALFLYVTGTKATDVSGTVTSNTTWTAAGSPYIVVNNIEVYPGITLTIENGVEVKFNSGRYLYVRGTLNATGVKFTGNAGVTKGFWDGIYVSYEYNEVGNVNLTNCTVEYASNLYIRKGQLTLNNCLVNNLSGTIRIHTSQCTLNIDNTTISNTNFPITYYAPGVINPGSNIVFSNNAYNFVDIDFSEVNELFWLKNFGQPYFNDNSIQVRAAGTLKMDPGVNLQIQNTEIRIYGKIKAIGTKEKPVIFDKSPASSYWLGLNILNSSIDTACIVKNAIICNANYNYHEWYQALEIENASPTIDSCLFYGNAYNLHIYGDSKPVISNTVLRKSITTASEAFNLIMDMNANPTFTNDSIQFNNTEIRAIGIRENTVSSKTARLKKINFAGINNISYFLYNNTTVHDTASLTIDPGVVIKTRSYSQLIGNGKITAIGTDAEPIVFTHLGDDNFGNPLDTQNDGTQTPGVSNAGRIMLYSTEESRLEKCKILYGGYDSNNWAIYLSNSNVVNNCEIKNSHNGVLFTKNAKITNNAFVNMPKYTIGYTLSTGNPILTGNTVANMGYIGILLDGTVTNDSPTLKKMNFAGYTNLPYILTSPFTIVPGNLVTIEPGVVIKFHNYWNQGILVNGGLKAIGTKTEKIIFTSIQDDSAGGDANNNGTGSVPGYDDWKGICFSSVSSDADNVLKNCEVRYAGDGYIDGAYTNAPIGISSSRVLIDSVKVNFSSRCGIAIFGDANPEIKNTTISNISWEPIYMDMFSNPKFDENITLANVANIALKLRAGVVSGTVPKRSFAGYNPITYGWFDDALTVNSQLTIPAGLTFKGNGRWNIYGKLNILGTADNPVVFTTAEDDAYGNPKDGQQNGQAGYNQHANYFVFYDASNDSSVIENATFRYSYQVPLQLNNASPTIRNCKFENFSKIAISLAGNSAPAINNCVFSNVSYPFNTSLLTYPSSTVGNVMTGSTGRGIRVNDETLTQDSYLPKRAFGGINNIPYVFRNYTIGSSAKLTVEPGVVLKFEDYGYINVQNGLIANGGSTTDSVIVFTSARDDFYGGDTYNNGTADGPWNYAWQGIYFYNESIDESCILKNCIIKWGSYPDSRGAVTLDNASPTIQNCRFEKGYHGVMCLNTSLPTLADCDFIDTEYNNGYAVWNKNSANTVTATNCYFNSNTGPRHSTNPLGTGTRVSDYVNFTPFKTYMAKAELGDVSLNGTITAYDASLILQHTVSNITLTPAQRNVADITKNGAITAYDASQILQYNVGLILTFTPNPSMIRKNVPALASADINFGSITPTTTNGEFIVPVRVNSGSGVKSIDMQLGFNANHLNLTKITSANLNNDISFSNSENLTNGNISLSMASAYDLDLNDAWVYLTFRLKNPMIDVSEIRINNALANETEVTTDNPTLQVQTRIISSTANLLQNKPLNIWANENGINIDLEAQALSNDLLITLSDVSGRTVFTKNYNISNRKFIEIPYSETGNLQNGIYLIQVNAGSRNFSEKLIINRK